MDAAEPLGVPVFPVVAYGLTPYFLGYPGTVSLRLETYVRLVRDILDSLRGQGFRRILIVNGHGGNSPAGALAIEWMADNPDSNTFFFCMLAWLSCVLVHAAATSVEPDPMNGSHTMSPS